MLIVFVMPRSLLAPSSISLGRQIFHPFYARLFRSSWDGVCLPVVCFFPPVLWFRGSFPWAWCLDQRLPSLGGKCWNGGRFCLTSGSVPSITLGKMQFDYCFSASMLRYWVPFSGCSGGMHQRKNIVLRSQEDFIRELYPLWHVPSASELTC